MGINQSDYPSGISAAYEGMLVSTEPNNLISRQAETAIEFGRLVVQGTADNQVVEASALGELVRGISVRDSSAVGTNFAVNDSALIIDRGPLYVMAGAACAAGAPVYMILATKRFTSATAGNLAVPNAVFDTSGVDGELVKVRLK